MPEKSENTYRFQVHPGTLYLCPTPLGNLGDITLRTIEVLEQAEVILAEDTRRTRVLLNHLGLKKTMISYHEHNRKEKEPQVLQLLQQGRTVALVTDAGMPGISDPGTDLVKLCLHNQCAFEVLPGPSAVLLALAASGLSTERFVFEGFLPRDKKSRRERLASLSQEERTMVFYEAPHRIKATLKEISMIMTDRSAAVGRELTKIHETWYRDTLSGILLQLEQDKNGLRGEMVLVVAGRSREEREQGLNEAFSHQTVEAHVMELMEKGMDKKAAIKEVSRQRNMPKRDVYRHVVNVEGDDVDFSHGRK